MRQLLIKFIAVFVALVGVSVMYAWWSDITFFKTIAPGFITMKFTTALCFASAGAILFLILRYLEEPSDVTEMIILFMSLIIFILMGTIFISQFFNIKIGLGNLFVSEIDIADGSIPGQPSLGNILSFLLIALAGVMAVKDFIKYRHQFFSIGAIIGIIGLLALVGYGISIPFLYWNFYGASNAMAIYSAFLFILLGAGFMLLPVDKNPEEIKQKLSIQKRFEWSLIIFVLTPFILTAFFVVSGLRVQMSAEAVSHLEAIAHIQELRIAEAIRKYEIMAEGITSRTQLQNELQIVNVANNIEARNSQIQTILSAALKPMGEIKEVALFNNKNKLLLIAPPKVPYTEYQLLFDQLKGRSFLAMKEKDRYALYFVRPLVSGGREIGNIIFNFGPQLFEDIAGDYTGLGTTGEILLGFQNNDGDVEFLTEGRDPQKKRIIKSTETAMSIIQAVIYKQNATFESSSDYRNVSVIAVTKYLKKLGWGMVVKMDQKEIFSPLNEVKPMVAIIFIVASFFSIIIAVIFGRKLIC